MKTAKRFFIIVSLILASSSVFGQVDNSFFNEYGEVDSNLPTSGPKEGLEPIEFLNPRADDIFWEKAVYRIIDLREKINFPLYYPEDASDGRQSLFALMFRLIETGKVYGYEWQESREVFSDEFKIDFKDLLDGNNIYYQTEIDPITNEEVYIVNESDIPNRDVMKFYLKEAWYFDKHSSIFNVKTIAICPVITRETEVGIQQFPLFWIPFDMLRPHLSQTEVLLSDKNNGMRLSFDDLFIKRRYGSYVYKSSNVPNRLILEYCNTAEEVKKVQDALKTEIINFEEDLWEY